MLFEGRASGVDALLLFSAGQSEPPADVGSIDGMDTVYNGHCTELISTRVSEQARVGAVRSPFYLL